MSSSQIFLENVWNGCEWNTWNEMNAGNQVLRSLMGSLRMFLAEAEATKSSNTRKSSKTASRDSDMSDQGCLHVWGIVMYSWYSVTQCDTCVAAKPSVPPHPGPSTALHSEEECGCQFQGLHTPCTGPTRFTPLGRCTEWPWRCLGNLSQDAAKSKDAKLGIHLKRYNMVG